MPDEQMAFLDAGGDARRGFECQFREFSAFRLFFAGEGDGDAAAFVGGSEAGEDVGAGAAGGDAEGDIAGLGEGFDLAGEDGFKAEIVAVGGQDGGVGREGESGQCGAVFAVAHDELGGEVLGICGAAAVAEEDDLFAVFERGEPGVGQRGDLIAHRAEASDGVLMLCEVRLE